MRYLNVVVFMVVLSAGSLFAQQPPEFPGAQSEHEWLRKLVGEWKVESSGSMAEGQPPIECEGTINSRMLGDFWVVSEMKAGIPGGMMEAIQTIGYDPEKQKYIGTWVDSMSGHIWNYEGTVDPSGKKLVLEADGPNFMAGGKMTKFRDAYEFKSPDHVVTTSSMLGEDGEWYTFMTGESRRVN